MTCKQKLPSPSAEIPKATIFYHGCFEQQVAFCPAIANYYSGWGASEQPIATADNAALPTHTPKAQILTASTSMYGRITVNGNRKPAVVATTRFAPPAVFLAVAKSR